MKIDNPPPFEGYNCYLSTDTKQGRKFVSLVNMFDYTDRTTISYAAFLLSVDRGKLLDSRFEQADHINNDPSDDRLENLQILTPEENNAKNHLVHAAKLYELTCFMCGKVFYRQKQRLKYPLYFMTCSRSCGSKKGHLFR